MEGGKEYASHTTHFSSSLKTWCEITQALIHGKMEVAPLVSG